MMLMTCVVCGQVAGGFCPGCDKACCAECLVCTKVTGPMDDEIYHHWCRLCSTVLVLTSDSVRTL
jgi:hypothetical protein